MAILILALIVLSVGGLLSMLLLGRNRYSDFAAGFTIVSGVLLLAASIMMIVSQYT